MPKAAIAASKATDPLATAIACFLSTVNANLSSKRFT